jgi:D-alanyl-D-alanine carboxypeptidase (penicillin-binding protein 5/6)
VTQHEPHDGLDELARILLQSDNEDDDSTRVYQSLRPGNGERWAEDADVQITHSKRRWRGRIVGIVITVLVIAVIASYVGITLTAPVGAAAATTVRPDVAVPAAAKIVMPDEGESALSIAGADDYLGRKADVVFVASGGNGALPMASISKLVTAMVVLSAKPLNGSSAGPTITFDKADEKLYDKYFALNATIAKMPTGSTMSERDALETMLVVSACNYAEAVADWAFGSEANYLYATRKWLTAHGMSHTTMVEPTGVDARNKSTPSDLIKLGKLTMANPAIASIVAKKSLDVPSLAGMPNTNDLLGTDGINGIKTGTLVPGGSDLLFSAVVPVGTSKPLTLTGVMLAGYSRTSVDTEVRALIESIKSGFHQVQLGTQGEVVGTYSTPWGAEASMVLGKSASTLTWSNEAITSSMTTTTIKTGKDGETVGTITWTAGKSTVSVPVVLQGSIKGPSAWWRLTHPSELLGK